MVKVMEQTHRLTLTVDQAAELLGISRSATYEAIRRDEVPHLRFGRRIVVPRAALIRMLGEYPQ